MNEAAEQVDVLIAGAGPTGLSTALALAPLGLRVVLADPQDAARLADPPPDGREAGADAPHRGTAAPVGPVGAAAAQARAPLQAASVSTGGAQAALRWTPRMRVSACRRCRPCRGRGWRSQALPWFARSGRAHWAGLTGVDRRRHAPGTLVSQNGAAPGAMGRTAALPGVRFWLATG